MAHVAIVFTGGTISMLPDPATGAAVPALNGAEILARTPGLDAIATLEPIDWGLVPASHLRFAQLLDLARIARDALARPDVDGAVVVQGTDTIEETAFAFDLLVAGPKPVVVVGAMRNAGDPGLRRPVQPPRRGPVAASPGAREQGTLVVMGGAHPAGGRRHQDPHRRLRHASGRSISARSARCAGNGATVSSLRARRRVLWRRSRTRPRNRSPSSRPSLRPMDCPAPRGRGRGAGRGGGGDGVGQSGSGPVDGGDRSDGHGHPGGAHHPLPIRPRIGRVRLPGGRREHWVQAGAILAGYLGGPKARVALALGIGAGLDEAGLRALFAD